MSKNISLVKANTMSDPAAISGDIPINTDDSPSVVLELIYKLKIKDVMCTAVITAKKTDTMRHVQAIMRENYITGLPVVEEKNLLGIITIEDLIVALNDNNIDKPVEELMTKDLTVLEADMPLSFAVSYLNKYRYSRYPVVNKNRELVGLLTSRDVIRALLVEINREVLRLEKINQKTSRNTETFSEMNFSTIPFDFELAGKASTEIKKALKQRSIDPAVIRRVAVASYELEINQVVHSKGGTINCSIQPDKVIIVASDSGPGIKDISLALKEGWSTADEWVRSLGFGAGMGLVNTKRVSDEFSLESKPGTGTTVRSVILFNSPKDKQ